MYMKRVQNLLKYLTSRNDANEIIELTLTWQGLLDTVQQKGLSCTVGGHRFEDCLSLKI